MNRTLFATYELDQEFVERTGSAVIDESGNGHRLAGEKCRSAGSPPTHRLCFSRAAISAWALPSKSASCSMSSLSRSVDVMEVSARMAGGIGVLARSRPRWRTD